MRPHISARSRASVIDVASVGRRHVRAVHEPSRCAPMRTSFAARSRWRCSCMRRDARHAARSLPRGRKAILSAPLVWEGVGRAGDALVHSSSPKLPFRRAHPSPSPRRTARRSRRAGGDSFATTCCRRVRCVSSRDSAARADERRSRFVVIAGSAWFVTSIMDAACSRGCPGETNRRALEKLLGEIQILLRTPHSNP